MVGGGGRVWGGGGWGRGGRGGGWGGCGGGVGGCGFFFFFNDTATTEIYTLSLHDALPICWFGERLLDFARSSQGRVSNLAAMVTEVIGGMRLVRAFAAESYEMRRFTEEADASRLAKYRAERAKAMQFVVVGFLQAMSVLLLFWLGGWQISQGQLTGAGFISYVAAVALLIDQIGRASCRERV